MFPYLNFNKQYLCLQFFKLFDKELNIFAVIFEVEFYLEFEIIYLYV